MQIHEKERTEKLRGTSATV